MRQKVCYSFGPLRTLDGRTDLEKAKADSRIRLRLLRDRTRELGFKALLSLYEIIEKLSDALEHTLLIGSFS